MSSKEALKVMADWVAAIADNVKNPIAGIGAVLDHAEGNIHDARLIGASIAQIRRRLEILDEYVSELSDFARPAVVYPNVIKVETLAAYALEAAALPASCETVVVMPSDLAVNVDATKLELVLKALLRNGYEAVDAHRPPRIRMSAAALTTGSLIAVTVEDNGPGMDPAAAERALEPFFTTKEAGTGLGLATARKYVEAHGGTLVIERSPTLGGCRVVLTLPGVTGKPEGEHK